MKLKPSAEIFLKKALGDSGFEELEKFELYKKKTNTVVSPEEIRIALQVVPRTILSLLHKELGDMDENQGKEVKIPVQPEATLQVTKFANDVYSGEIIQQGKVVANFKYRSLPGVGLVIMSTFEMYDISDLNRMGQDSFSLPEASRLQDIIDQRLNLRDVISRVVDEKISQRQAIEELVRARLTEMLKEKDESKAVPEAKPEEKKEKKALKLREFLENKSKKAAPAYQIKIEKSEQVTCPDCGKKIFDKSGFSGCVCFGADRDRKIHLKKTEDGVKLSFSNAWDKENIEMLLEVLRERNNRHKNGK